MFCVTQVLFLQACFLKIQKKSNLLRFCTQIFHLNLILLQLGLSKIHNIKMWISAQKEFTQNYLSYILTDSNWLRESLLNDSFKVIDSNDHIIAYFFTKRINTFIYMYKHMHKHLAFMLTSRKGHISRFHWVEELATSNIRNLILQSKLRHMKQINWNAIKLTSHGHFYAHIHLLRWKSLFVICSTSVVALGLSLNHQGVIQVCLTWKVIQEPWLADAAMQ